MPGIRCSSVAASMAFPARNAASAKIEYTWAFEEFVTLSAIFRLTQANLGAQCTMGEATAWEEITIRLAVRLDIKHLRTAVRKRPRRRFWNAAVRFGGPFRPQPPSLWRLPARKPRMHEDLRSRILGHRPLGVLAFSLFARALRMPALTRSTIKLRSSSATAPRTVKIIFPVGVLVSTFSERDTKSIPSAWNCSSALSKWDTERAKRSKRHTTSTSKRRRAASTINLSSPGREFFVPETLSV